MTDQTRSDALRLPDQTPPQSRVADTLNIVGFIALLAVIALAAVPYGTVEPWSEALFQILVFVIAPMWVVEGAILGKWFHNEHSVVIPLVAIAAYAFLQSLPILPTSQASLTSLGVFKTAISADPFESRIFALKLLTFSFVVMLFISYSRRMSRVRVVIAVVIAIAVSSSLFGMTRQTMQRSEGFFLPLLRVMDGYGQFINKNHFAFLMEMAFGLAIGSLAARGMKREQSFLLAALALPIWLALVLSNSRGGIIGMIAQLGFIALFANGQRETTAAEPGWLGAFKRARKTQVFRISSVAAMLIAISVGVIWIGGDNLVKSIGSINTEFQNVPDETNSGSTRREIWRSTLRLIADNPVAGVGFGGYWIAITKYHDASGFLIPQQAHNDYLEIFASGGIIGLALVAWFGVTFVRLARVQLKSNNRLRRGIAFGAIAGLFGIAVHSLFDFGVHITVNSAVACALAAIAVVDSR